MTRMLTLIGAASVLALASSGAFAECFTGHTAMIMTQKPVEATAMSTFSGKASQLVAEEKIADPAPCAADDPACATKAAE